MTNSTQYQRSLARGGGSRRARRRRIWLVGFFVYAAALALATHWPDVKIPGPERLHPDKIVHVSAFFVWTWLLLASGLVGDWRRGRSWALALLVAVVVAALDESTQAFPGLHREVSVWDATANVVGACLALATAAIAVFYGGRRSAAA